MTQIFKEAPVVTTNSAVSDHSYINVLLTTDNVSEFRPQYGIRVQDNVSDKLLPILNRMIETGNKTALNIEIVSVTLGADFRAQDSIDDPELDALIGNKKAAPLFNSMGKSKVREPIMFWINYKVTTPYAKDPEGNDAVIRTDSTAITSKAPRQMLADLLKISKVEMDMFAEVELVRSANPIAPKLTLEPLDF